MDGYLENSVNWDDDADAIAFTLATEKDDGTLKYKAGVAILSRDAIDLIAKLAGVMEVATTGKGLTYERQPLEGNRYHGNLLVEGAMSADVRKQIEAALALHSKRITEP